ncbi:MAG: hypothetical protein EOO28_34780 [Comamonadaceae bacterium]|nr:MAG: hypothetical protein EOO28_34780 [Comamonadaceae bacterium]
MRRTLSPAKWLLLAMTWAVLMLASTLHLATSQPWLGLKLQWSDEARGAVVASATGPSLAVPPGAAITGLSVAGGAQIALEKHDFAISPDSDLTTLSAYDDFLERQGRIAALQGADQLTLLDSEGQSYTIRPADGRPLSSFPPDFWVQMLVGLVGWLISAGVWSFRRHHIGARWLLLSGWSTLLFATFAAVYTTRELALPAELFRGLCDLNFLGGSMYVATMVALLWYYPRRLGRFSLGPLLLVIYLAGWFMQELRLVDSMLWGRRTLVFAGLLATMALAVVQWRSSRVDPVSRAALQWFLLSWLVGVVLFSMLIFVPQLFGVSTAPLQGYAFLLFLLVYGGVAVGIMRFRLFELGDWWPRVVLWLAMAAVFVLLDMVLLVVLVPAWSASVSLLVCGFLWLPLRGWLWARATGQTAMERGELFRRVVDVSLAPSLEERIVRGRALLTALFEPLEIVIGQEVPVAAITDDGLVMQLPAQGQVPPMLLRYPGRGRRLFTSRDLAVAQEMNGMLAHAAESREAYRRGMLAERGRIARDLHDDIGARLLSSLHQPSLAGTRDIVQHAMTEMRTIVNGLNGEPLALGEMVAELRHETALRLEVAGMALDWPLPQSDAVRLGYRAWRNGISMMRELVSNIIRHSGARQVRITVDCTAGWLRSSVEDDGCGMKPGASTGNGLQNLRRRAESLGATVDITSGPGGTRVCIGIPLEELKELKEPGAMKEPAEPAEPAGSARAPHPSATPEPALRHDPAGAAP